METTKHFPNGFDSWMETHHEIVEYITKVLEADDCEDSQIGETQDQLGTGGLYDLGRKWTDEFEEMNKDRDWDGEYFDEIWDFCLNKNYNNR